MNTLSRALLLATALSTPGLAHAIDENSPFVTVPAGTRLTLKSPLPVRAGQTRLYLQQGLILPPDDVDVTVPYCWLGLARAPAADSKLQPNVFTVARVDDGTTDAEDSELPLPTTPDGEQPLDTADVLYRTVLFVRSSAQPALDTVTCEQLDDVRLGQYLSISDIRIALGALFSLQLPAP
jgi:hypothetical protein